MTAQEAFARLHGPGRPLTYAQARIEIAWELGLTPLQFDPRYVPSDDEEVLEAIEAVRSYQEVAHIIERDPPSPLPISEREMAEAREMIKLPGGAGKSNPKKSVDKTVAAQNSLWKKPSY